MEQNQEKVSSGNVPSFDIRPSERYKNLLTVNRSTDEPYSWPSLFGSENLKSLLLKCGESIALRGGALLPVNKVTGYTESPWYETPFYRKLRGDKPIPKDPPDTEPESTDTELMYNTMGMYSTGPSTPNTSDIERVASYLPTDTEDEQEGTGSDYIEVDPNRPAPPIEEYDDEEFEKQDLNHLHIHEVLRPDDDEGENQWAKMIEQDMKPQPGIEFWDVHDPKNQEKIDNLQKQHQ